MILPLHDVTCTSVSCQVMDGPRTESDPGWVPPQPPFKQLCDVESRALYLPPSLNAAVLAAANMIEGRCGAWFPGGAMLDSPRPPQPHSVAVDAHPLAERRPCVYATPWEHGFFLMARDKQMRFVAGFSFSAVVWRQRGSFAPAGGVLSQKPMRRPVRETVFQPAACAGLQRARSKLQSKLLLAKGPVKAPVKAPAGDKTSCSCRRSMKGDFRGDRPGGEAWLASCLENAEVLRTRILTEHRWVPGI